MKANQKRCMNCGRSFQPDPRTARFQKFCARKACQAARRRRKLRRWRSLYPDSAKRYQPKVRAWAKAYPDYWRRYRAAHAGYREHERQRMANRRRRQKRVAKETAIGRIVVEKLRALDALKRPQSVTEDCLRSTAEAVCVAKRIPIARPPLFSG